MQIERRLARAADIDSIASIVLACSLDLKNRRLPDWSNYYTVDRLSEKLEKQTAYLFSIEGRDVGVVFLSTVDIYYYSKVDLKKFAEPDSKAYYISTLAVSPEYQHRGIASEIINFCEELVKKEKIKYLRLDCLGKDNLLVGFYKKRGFKVISEMENEKEYFLLEKRIGEENSEGEGGCLIS